MLCSISFNGGDMKRKSKKLLETKSAYKRLFIKSVKRGLADADSGRVHSTEDVRKVLQNRRQHRGRGA